MANGVLAAAKSVGHAVAAGIVTAAAYLTGVLGADEGLGDVTTVQWLGLIVFVGGVFGITTAAKKSPPSS